MSWPLVMYLRITFVLPCSHLWRVWTQGVCQWCRSKMWHQSLIMDVNLEKPEDCDVFLNNDAFLHITYQLLYHCEIQTIKGVDTTIMDHTKNELLQYLWLYRCCTHLYQCGVIIYNPISFIWVSVGKLHNWSCINLLHAQATHFN